ncbi:hypothetical protein V498_07504 [Pseudogymnoascus sp. VKM F-4517 (FW-2822)]|nr:hypothetical protein V498_07504 [Pseudogymnoascus sp. VKM F-4517 (FW-2822)]
MKYLEIACFNAPSALIAARAGADRIELCADRSVGGTTPPLSDLEAIKAQQVEIPVMVMIRPRGGDFVYSDEEFAQMKEEMKRFRGLADGFVFGILKEEGGEVVVDGERNSELVELARPLPCRGAGGGKVWVQDGVDVWWDPGGCGGGVWEPACVWGGGVGDYARGRGEGGGAGGVGEGDEVSVVSLVWDRGGGGGGEWGGGEGYEGGFGEVREVREVGSEEVGCEDDDRGKKHKLAKPNRQQAANMPTAAPQNPESRKDRRKHLK